MNPHYLDVISQWDPASEVDLPDEVALHLDACESCAAAFDSRFEAWADTSPAVEAPAFVLPATQNRRRSWLPQMGLAAVALLATGGVLAGLATMGGTVMRADNQALGTPDPQVAFQSALSTSQPDDGVADATTEAWSAARNTEAEIGSGVVALGYIEGEENGASHQDLKRLEQDVDKLREQAFRSKSTLTLLKEGVITDGRYNEGGETLFWKDTESSGEGYRYYGVNGFAETAKDALSTFAVDVDTASYTMTRKKLLDGYMPAVSSIRVEEFVNYFPYDYIPPQSSPFSVAFEGAPTPWNGNTWLVKVGVQGKRIDTFERKPVHLTFLVDTSGSMRAADKMDLVQSSLRMLTSELDDGDTVAIVAYAGSAGLVLEPTPMSRKADIMKALSNLQAGGSTAMGSGIELAYRLADQTYADGAVNRVIIASDGDANVGQTNQQALSKQIEAYANRGITLTTIGFGTGNYQDTMMEQLANQGDGNYFYIDSEKEARRIFVDKLCSTMEVIAKDVKIQVDWNPDRVKGYRLVGYENRDIADRDFRNDAVDAGEIGTGHQVTALYEVVLRGGSDTDDLATVRIRNKAPGPESPAVERTYVMPQRSLQSDFDESSADFRIAISAAGFAELLRQSPHIHEMTYTNFAYIARNAARPEYAEDLELVRLLTRAAQLSGE